MAKLKNKVEKTVTFEDGKEVKIYVQRPNNQTVKLADRHKSKAWNQAIQDDVLTKKELGVLMKKRGIWDEAKAKEEDDITRDIVKLERELYTGKDGKSKPKVSEGRDIAVEIRKARMELRELIAERISLEENTAESLAIMLGLIFWWPTVLSMKTALACIILLRSTIIKVLTKLPLQPQQPWGKYFII